MITIIDYNMGNVGSIRNMLKKVGVESRITAEPSLIAVAEKLVLPGVGAFDAGMDNLQRSGAMAALRKRVLEDRVPILGICLGMQLMARSSEEGQRAGLGWIDAEVLRFDSGAALKVPHMGWNRVEVVRESPLTASLPAEPRFYFVHSYFVRCRNEADVLLSTPYGRPFHSAFRRDNVYGVQFHPEKSHKFGMALLANFAGRCNA